MVYILLANGFEEAEALVPLDLLRRAGIEAELASNKKLDKMGGHGLTVKVDRALAEIDLTRTDMLVLPGGGIGVKNLNKDPSVAAMVQEAVDRNIWVAAICAAPTLLGKWGHLRGRAATCYPGMEDGLVDALPRDAGVVVDGKIITGRAAGSAFEFGLKLVEVLAGPEKAEEIRSNVYYG